MRYVSYMNYNYITIKSQPLAKLLHNNDLAAYAVLLHSAI